MADKKAILKAGDKEIELPILSGTAGQDVIDIRALGKHGYFTYDPGFLATGSCAATHLTRHNTTSLRTLLSATPWCTNKLICSSTASATTLTLWRC